MKICIKCREIFLTTIATHCGHCELRLITLDELINDRNKLKKKIDSLRDRIDELEEKLGKASSSDCIFCGGLCFIGDSGSKGDEWCIDCGKNQ